MDRLGSALERPFPYKETFLAFTVLVYLFEEYIGLRQYRLYRLTRPPKNLAEHVEQDKFEKSQDYGRDKARLRIVSSAFDLVQLVLLISFDVLPWLWAKTRLTPGSRLDGEIMHSLIFATVFMLGSSVLSLPFSLYSTFVVEQKHGFNKQTLSLWLADLAKGLLLGVALGWPVGAAFLKIIIVTGDNFLLYVMSFLIVFQFIMITLFPLVIQPLFNKVTPLEEGELRHSVERLAKSLKFPLTRLFVIDGSKRSAHSNAYMYGLPNSKRIVLFDTLVEKASVDEVTAVLAHELGHWKLGHTVQMLLIAQVQLAVTFTLFGLFIKNPYLFDSFGFRTHTQEGFPVIIAFILFQFVLSPLDTVVSFIMHAISRRAEYQADEFAAKLEDGKWTMHLKSSLIKLQVQNLSTMHTDPWFSALHHSHPTLPERLDALDRVKSSSRDASKNVNGSHWIVSILLNPFFLVCVPVALRMTGYAIDSIQVTSAVAGVIAVVSTRILLSLLGKSSPSSSKGLDGKTAVVTGGAQGIGFLLTQELSSRGCRVVILDVVPPRCALENASNVLYLECDISSRQQLQKAADRLRQWQDQDPEILINNAAVVVGKELLDPTLTVEQLETSLRVNLVAHFYTLKQFLPSMVERDDGHVVTIASVLGLAGVAQLTDYCAAKSGLIGLHESLEAELRTRYRCQGVKTTLVTPGQVKTALFQGVEAHSTRTGRPRHFLRWLNTIIAPPLEPEKLVARIVRQLERHESGWICEPRYVILARAIRAMPKVIRDAMKWLSGADYAMIGWQPKDKVT